MEEKHDSSKIWRLAADSTGGRLAGRTPGSEKPVTEDASPEVARENIVKEMMRIFDGLLGCSAKRTGVSLAFMHATKSRPEKVPAQVGTGYLPAGKGLVETGSPNTGFALNVLFNNGTYYYNKAQVPVSFGAFLTSLVEFLEGHDCLNICPDEMTRLRSLLERG
ncbi:MAG: hypothetical protein IPQ16_10935 [Geobacteraceae bacterium]|nr:hypothetical protein [Geobacteraceae bacterium]